MPSLVDTILNRPSQSYADPSGASHHGGGGGKRGSIFGGSSYAPSMSSFGMSESGKKSKKTSRKGLSRSYYAPSAPGDGRPPTMPGGWGGSSTGLGLRNAPKDFPNAMPQKSLLQGDMFRANGSLSKATAGGTSTRSAAAGQLQNGYRFEPANAPFPSAGSAYTGTTPLPSATMPPASIAPKAHSVAGGRATPSKTSSRPLSQAAFTQQQQPPPVRSGQGGLDGRGTWGPMSATARGNLGGVGGSPISPNQGAFPAEAYQPAPSVAGSTRSKSSWFSSLSKRGKKTPKSPEMGSSAGLRGIMSAGSLRGSYQQQQQPAGLSHMRGPSVDSSHRGVPMDTESNASDIRGKKGNKKWWQRKGSEDNYLVGSPQSPQTSGAGGAAYFGAQNGGNSNPSTPGLAGVGAANGIASSVGHGSSPVPPLPHHDPAELRAMTIAGQNRVGYVPPPSEGTPSRKALKQAASAIGISPLGQQPSGLLAQGPPMGSISGGSQRGRGRTSQVHSASDAGSVGTLRHRLSTDFSRPGSPTLSSGSGVRRKGSQSDWKSFVSVVSGTEIAKTWERPQESIVTAPPEIVRDPAARRMSLNEGGTVTGFTNGSTVGGLDRRKSLVDRVKRELEGDAKYDHDQTEAGHALQSGDLLARAAASIVGSSPTVMSHDGTDSSASASVATPTHPTVGLAPGVVIPSAAAAMPGASMPLFPGSVDVSRPFSPPPRVLSPPPRVLSPPPNQQSFAKQPVQQPIALTGPAYAQHGQNESALLQPDIDRSLPPTPFDMSPVTSQQGAINAAAPSAPAATEEEGSSSGTEEDDDEEEVESSSDEDHKREGTKAQLAVLAEESDEGSGSDSEKGSIVPIRHEEMRLIASNAQQAARRHAAFDAALRRGSPSETSSPVKPKHSTIAPTPVHANAESSTDDMPQSPATPTEANSRSSAANTAPRAPSPTGSEHSKRTTKSVAFDRRPSTVHTIEAKDDGSGTRDATAPGIVRRLSDVSLGTAFTMNGVINSTGRMSRTSSRASRSGEEELSSDDDVEMRSKAKVEIDRLRSMKVGEEFFGPSLTSILDSFGAKNLSQETINRVIESQPETEQDVQNVINSIRAQRANKPDVDVKTVESDAFAPSIAAALMLAETDDLPTVSEGTPKARVGSFNDLFMPPSMRNTVVEPSKSSILNRPRVRKSDPTMSIPEPNDPPAILPPMPASPDETLRQTLSLPALSSPPLSSPPLSSPPLSSPPLSSPTKSKGKSTKPKTSSAAPVKSAMKAGKEKPSLADTLFSFPSPTRAVDVATEGHDEREEKDQNVVEQANSQNEKPSSPLEGPASIGMNRSAAASEAGSIASDTRSVGSHGSGPYMTPEGTPMFERSQEDGGLSRSYSSSGEVSAPVRRRSTKRKTSQTKSKSSTAPVPEEITEPVASSRPESIDDSRTESDAHTIRGVPATSDPSSSSPLLSAAFVSGAAAIPGAGDDNTSWAQPSLSAAAIPGMAFNDLSPPISATSPFSASSASESMSEASTQPTSIASYSPHNPTQVLVQGKDMVLAMPPAPSMTEMEQDDLTPMAGPSMKLTPPTPPAFESRGSYGLASIQPSGSLVDPVDEEAETEMAQIVQEAKSNAQFSQFGKSPVAAFMEPPSRLMTTTPGSSAGHSARSTPSPAPPVPSKDLRAEALQRLSLPGQHASGSQSSNSSDSLSASPAPSVSGGRSPRSQVHSASGSEASLGASSNYSRKPRQQSYGTYGSARPTMDSINEWESSVPGPVRPTPLITPGHSVYASSVSRSVSSVDTGPTPDLIKSAPIGAPAALFLDPPVPKARQSLDSVAAPLSLDGHGALSEYSSVASQSAFSLPASAVSPTRMARPIRPLNEASNDTLHTRTTMTSIAITGGAFTERKKSRRTSKTPASEIGSERGSIDSDAVREELAMTKITVTAHSAPPRKVSSTQLLCQIIAVAIDEIDRMIVRERAAGDNAYGFVPGRSFCGRIVEAGWEVKGLRKGDVVFGLQEARKCGALAEFMIIDQYLVTKAPEDCLTTEQIAALPSTGVMAFQIMRDHCSQLTRGSRVLILNAHDGVGLLTMQECVGLGLIIVAHCPPSATDGYSICQANGAHEVIVGEPLWAINSLHESSFDLVLDTIGGRRIYDASRRIISSQGQFITCFGDEHTTANPNLKAHLRSLRRAFFKKDKKNIGYEWVGADSGEDCREALEAVRRAAEAGHICPRLGSILSLEDGPRAFDPVLRGTQDVAGAVVIRM